MERSRSILQSKDRPVFTTGVAISSPRFFCLKKGSGGLSLDVNEYFEHDDHGNEGNKGHGGVIEKGGGHVRSANHEKTMEQNCF